MTSTRPLEIRPIIRELVRTGICFPNITLLVDKIVIAQTAATVLLPARSLPETRSSPDPDTARPSFKHNQQRRAYRLYLADGDKSIQGLPKRSLHSSILNGVVREGSIIVLKDYELSRGRRVNDGSASRSERATGEVIYLSISDFLALGHDGRKSRDGSRENMTVEANVNKETERADTEPGNTEADQYSARKKDGLEKLKQEKTDLVPTALLSIERTRDHSLVNAKATPDKVNDDILPKASPFMTALESCSPQRPIDRLSDDNPQTQVSLDTDSPPQPVLLPACVITSLAELISPSTPRHTLASVLAQITHVSAHTFKPPSLPLRKRDLRIRDGSTRKHVLLSVFVDADTFQPAVGTVALFRGVRSHDWGGGNLKKWPRDYVGGWDKAGKDPIGATTAAAVTAECWYVSEPAGKVEGISIEDVEGVRSSVSKWAREEEEERAKWQSGGPVNGPGTKRRRMK